MLNLSDEKNKNVESHTIAVPKNVTLTQEGSDLLIKRKWSVYSGVKNLGWSAFTLVLTLYLFASSLQQTLANNFFSIETLALVFIFGLFFVLGIYWLVLGIYQIVNSTIIRLNTSAISTQHQPLSWHTRTFSVPEIEQVFIMSHVVGDILGSSKSFGRERGKRVRYDYSVNLLMLGGQKAMLIQQLPNIQAQFIQQELERHLSVENRVVKSET